MIFLLKDRSFKVFKPWASPEKTANYFERHKDQIEAVLVDASSSQHGDTFVLVKRDHYRPFCKVSFTCTLCPYAIELPIDYDQSFTRTIEVTDASTLYPTLAMLYQVEKLSEMSDQLSLGESRVMLVRLVIKTREGTFEWDRDKDTLQQFLERNEFYCDVDDFLNGTMPEAGDDEVLDGYIQRYDRKSNTNRLMYYHHGRRSRLLFLDGLWSKTPPQAIADLDYFNTQFIVGFCINGTGLIYLAEGMMAIYLYKADSCSITIEAENLDKMDTSVYDKYYESFNLADILYMAIFLPQIWDVERYITGVTPTRISCEFTMDKHNIISGEYAITKGDKDEGLTLDLFNVFSRVFSNGIHPIEIYD